MVELTVSVVTAGGEVIVSPSGEVDAATAPQLLAELQRAASARPPRVIVDLAALSFIDSTGMGVLVTALKALRGSGGEMVLRSPSPSTLKVLQITGLDQVFAIT